MNLFLDDLLTFFDDSLLNKISKKCIEISNQAYQVNNGNIPKWSQAINAINSLSKGLIKRAFTIVGKYPRDL